MSPGNRVTKRNVAGNSKNDAIQHKKSPRVRAQPLFLQAQQSLSLPAPRSSTRPPLPKFPAVFQSASSLLTIPPAIPSANCSLPPADNSTAASKMSEPAHNLSGDESLQHISAKRARVEIEISSPLSGH
eukprot:TRINITY_DN8854_c0_g1_i1.p1 TRINITY_DN8854_c0_g1~~TRINITY_DN8854_c0_g1_i1.p1  ORF type:complete len:129 (+),score=8.66 TRINITY_DN8854_c0_g1_i1:249-635(+)